MANVIGSPSNALLSVPTSRLMARAERRMNPGAGRIKDELADRNRHAARALIPRSQDAFVVRYHDKTDVSLMEIPESLGDLTTSVRTQEQTTWTPVDMAVLLASKADGGRVDDGGQALQVLDEQTIKKSLIPIQQSDQPDILFERIDFEKICSSSIATCCSIVSTAGGSTPSMANLRRSSWVKAGSLLSAGSRSTCSPCDQRASTGDFRFIPESNVYLASVYYGRLAVLGYTVIAFGLTFFDRAARQGQTFRAWKHGTARLAAESKDSPLRQRLRRLGKLP